MLYYFVTIVFAFVVGVLIIIELFGHDGFDKVESWQQQTISQSVNWTGHINRSAISSALFWLFMSWFCYMGIEHTDKFHGSGYLIFGMITFPIFAIFDLLEIRKYERVC